MMKQKDCRNRKLQNLYCTVKRKEKPDQAGARTIFEYVQNVIGIEENWCERRFLCGGDVFKYGWTRDKLDFKIHEDITKKVLKY